jgi:hypothetical protein
VTEQIHIEVSRTTRTVVSGKWIFLTQSVPAQPAEKDNSQPRSTTAAKRCAAFAVESFSLSCSIPGLLESEAPALPYRLPLCCSLV